MEREINLFNLLGLPVKDYMDVDTNDFITSIFEYHATSRMPHVRDLGSILDGNYQRTTSGLPCSVVINDGRGYIRRSDGMQVKIDDKLMTVLMRYAATIRIYWPVKYDNLSISNIVYCIGRGNPLSLTRLVYCLYNGVLPNGGSAHILVDDEYLLSTGIRPELIGVRNEWVALGNPVNGIQYISGALTIGRKPSAIGVPVELYSIVKGSRMAIGTIGVVYLGPNKERYLVPNWFKITGLPPAVQVEADRRRIKQEKSIARLSKIRDNVLLNIYN